MSDIIFPVTLGAPLVDGFNEESPDIVVRTTMDQGPAKARRWGTANVREISCQYVFTKEQFTEFSSFFENTTASGALAFDWTHPITSTVWNTRFADNRYSYDVLGPNIFGVSLNLELLP